jgi:hypothetical protein
MNPNPNDGLAWWERSATGGWLVMLAAGLTILGGFAVGGYLLVQFKELVLLLGMVGVLALIALGMYATLTEGPR